MGENASDLVYKNFSITLLYYVNLIDSLLCLTVNNLRSFGCFIARQELAKKDEVQERATKIIINSGKNAV